MQSSTLHDCHPLVTVRQGIGNVDSLAAEVLSWVVVSPAQCTCPVTPRGQQGLTLEDWRVCILEILIRNTVVAV